MEKYYSLNWKESNDAIPSAFAPEGTPLAQDLVTVLNDVNRLSFSFNLVKLDVGKDGLIESNDLSGLKEIWLDYQPNNLAWPLMSERLKLLIEANLTGSEQIDWVTCIVKNGVDERFYFILRFNKMLDVLDMEKTFFVQGTDHIIKPVFANHKIHRYSIFPKPSSHNLWKITPALYVNEKLKKIIQKQKLTGLSFDKVAVSE